MKLLTSTLLAFALTEYGSAAILEQEAKSAVNASSYDFVCCHSEPRKSSQPLIPPNIPIDRNWRWNCRPRCRFTHQSRPPRSQRSYHRSRT
jgi:hypothetical protein